MRWKLANAFQASEGVTYDGDDDDDDEDERTPHELWWETRIVFD
jgi:hypothetical protein